VPIVHVELSEAEAKALNLALNKIRGEWDGGTQLRKVPRYAKAIPQSDEHPTPKPVPLLEELIRAAGAGSPAVSRNSSER
jgi:hypothetical protein